jgi:hypothetical protein
MPFFVAASSNFFAPMAGRNLPFASTGICLLLRGDLGFARKAVSSGLLIKGLKATAWLKMAKEFWSGVSGFGV